MGGQGLLLLLAAVLHMLIPLSRGQVLALNLDS